ncbi:MAG TPA: PfkB family carbohydrate kinase [Candidatus Saccharimonadales bacterium]|nr:PfkB family carbohydrate kinase [Candidatus Saccharimonadales bacterium]
MHNVSILVVGSVAFDTLKTPFGERKKILGGAATYFSLSASFFTPVRVVGVVGEDFTPEHEAVLTKRGIDTRGIEHASGKTFHWGGEYGENVNEAKTNFTDLNVFENFNPKIPAAYDDSEYLFLANIQPELQLDVRRKMPRVALVGGDTMNLWINIKRPELLETLKEVDILLINDGEAKLLTDENSLVLAARKILTMGPRSLVIKHGEYGATIFFGDGSHPFRAPALPIAEVHDPTGAGDTFAGGFMGYIASQPKLTPTVLKHAMFYGGVMGSFTVECFGPERLISLTREEIEERFKLFRNLTHLD